MKRAAFVSIGCALLAGCGGGGHGTTASTTPSTSTTTPNSSAQLEQGVRNAVEANSRLANWVLWHNSVPSWAAQSTGGPALAALRSAASKRHAEHIQLLGISPHFDVLTITLDPSYLHATATVRERGEVRPYRDGKPLGHAIKVNDVARLKLHRAGTAPRFLVWKVGSA